MTAELHRCCPVCEADQPVPHWQKAALRLVRCCQCGMVYADPVAKELADGTFYDERASRYYLATAKLQSDHAPVRYTRELRLFRNFCRTGDVLDVGCSTGGFLLSLRQGRGRTDAGPEPGGGSGLYRVTGLDVAGAALDHAAALGIEVIRAPFLDHDFGGRQFDAITFWAVLEHLVQPGAFLGQAATLLRPGGFCFILVPNLKSLAARLLGARYRYVTAEHVNYFTADTLRALAARAPSLAVVALRSTHFNPVVIWQDWRGGRDATDEERLRLLQRTTAWKQAWWLRPCRWMYSGLERALGAGRLADNLVLVLRKQ